VQIFSDRFRAKNVVFFAQASFAIQMTNAVKSVILTAANLLNLEKYVQKNKYATIVVSFKTFLDLLFSHLSLENICAHLASNHKNNKIFGGGET